MYFLSYIYKGVLQGGVLTDDGLQVVPLSAFELFNETQLLEFLREGGQDLVEAIGIERAAHAADAVALEAVTVTAPIPRPNRNIFCVGKNYLAHIGEVKTTTPDAVPKQPVYFTKLTTTVIGPHTPIDPHPYITSEVDYEGELAVVIGREGHDISAQTAKDYVFGYTIANDVSARDIQTGRGQWFAGKSLDTFCPMGPYILTADAVSFPPKLDISLTVNGELRQQDNTGSLIFSIPELIADLSKGRTLLPGDIILTGTPAGTGAGAKPPVYLKKGDTVAVTIAEIGTLTNPVV